MADERITEQGNRIDAKLVRSFIRAALDHDAVQEEVNDLLVEHVAEGKYHPTVVASSLRPFIDEILNAATDEDWRAIAAELTRRRSRGTRCLKALPARADGPVEIPRRFWSARRRT